MTVARHKAIARLQREAATDDLADTMDWPALRQPVLAMPLRQCGVGSKRLFSEEFAHEFGSLSLDEPDDMTPRRKKARPAEPGDDLLLLPPQSQPHPQPQLRPAVEYSSDDNGDGDAGGYSRSGSSTSSNSSPSPAPPPVKRVVAHVALPTLRETLSMSPLSAVVDSLEHLAAPSLPSRPPSPPPAPSPPLPQPAEDLSKALVLYVSPEEVLACRSTAAAGASDNEEEKEGKDTNAGQNAPRLTATEPGTPHPPPLDLLSDDDDAMQVDWLDSRWIV